MLIKALFILGVLLIGVVVGVVLHLLILYWLVDNPSELLEMDLSKCPGCGGPADNGFDRCDPPSPYYCTKCEGIEYE